jgi:hypothetical protein
MTKTISFSKFSEADTHKTQDGKTAKKGLWYNINQRKKKGLSPKKPGSKGYPKTLDIEAKEAFSASAIAKKPRTGDGKPLGGKLPSWMTTKSKPSMAKLDKPDVSAKDKNTLGKVAAMLAKEKPKKESYGDSITSPKMRALAKADSQPKKPVTLPKAPWEKGTNVTYDKKGRVVKEAVATMMVTRPGSNEPIKITATEWPSFKARGYHHAEQKENLNLINKIKRSGVVKTGSMSKDGGEAERKRAADFQAGMDKARANLKARQAARKANTDEAKLSEMHCRDCGCQYGNIDPDCDCPNDGSDKEGAHFVSMDEALDMKQRLARGRSARKNKAKMAMGRKRAGRRIASMAVLKKRARRAARKTMTKRLTKGIAKADLSVSRKREIEKRLDKPAFKTKVNRLVKRTIKDIRKKEIARKRK